MHSLRVLAVLSTAVSLFAIGYASAENVATEAAAPGEAAPVLTIGNPDRLSNDAPTVFITGSNRGIGFEFVKQFSERGWNIIATTRTPEKATELQEVAAGNEQIVIEQLDVTDMERISVLANKYGDRPIDILLNNAGLTPKYNSAFRTVSGVDWEIARESMEVNAFAPVRIAHAFMGQVAASEQKKIIVLSSKAGSFGSKAAEFPMFYGYRASKTALNMMMYTLAFETVKRDVILTLLSPGQVNTTPGFKRKGTIEPVESVSKMLKVIDGLTPEQNGKFLDYEDGRELDW